MTGLVRDRSLEVEIAVTSPAGAATAAACGAHRVELCTALELGGVTPSQALVEQSVETGTPVHVLIRCRPGDFVYDEGEAALMLREVRSVLDAGAAGVVVGALTADRSLDVPLLRTLVSAAKSTNPDADVTLHRAIDHAKDLVASVAMLGPLGFTRVLTSGGAASALEGRAMIGRMVEAAGSVQVMAGAGLRPEDVPMIAETGASAVHLSAKRTVRSTTGVDVPLGAADSGSAHFVVDAEIVTATVAAATTASRLRNRARGTGSSDDRMV